MRERFFHMRALADGPTLEEELREGPSFSPERVARIGEALCGVLAAAHEAGFVHGEVRSSRVILTTVAPGLRLLDADRAVDIGGAVAANDVAAVGNLLAGALALRASSPELAVCIDACLAVDPAARPSARALAEQLADVAELLGADPLVARDGGLSRLLRDVAHVEVAHVASAPPAVTDGPDPLIGTLFAGRYVVERLLAAGGMGAVYVAEQQPAGRKVALKVIKGRGLDAELRARFKRETSVLSSIHHPNVVSMFDCGVNEGSPFLVMELMQGTPLRHELDQLRASDTRMPWRRALKIASDMTRGLSAVHAAGVVHRDLKPDNVFLTSSMGHSDFAKLLDFGIVRRDGPGASTTQKLTQYGGIIGTPGYLSPEQLNGLDATARSDLYAIGVILYEMITGVFPFTAPSVVAMAIRQIVEPIAPLTRWVPDLPQGVQALVLALMARDPDARPASSHALLIELEAQAASAASMSPHPSLPPAARTERNVGTLIVPPPHLPAGRTAVPEIRYAKVGEAHVAYQVLGKGPVDLVLIPGFVSQLEHWWEEPEGRDFLEGFASFSRLIVFDKRGTGLSDRLPDDGALPLDERIDDVTAVMDAVGSTRAVIVGLSEGGAMSVLFAATRPERVSGLVLFGACAAFPWGQDASAERWRAAFAKVIESGWGKGATIPLFAPSVGDDPRLKRWMARGERLGASPGAALAIIRLISGIDVRAVLPSVHAPTLVVHREGDRIAPLSAGRYLATHIPHAKLVVLPGDDHLAFLSADGFLGEVEQFVTGSRSLPPSDRFLATILFTDIVRSTERSAELGDRAWRNLLERHDELAHRKVTVARGRVVKSAGDGILAVFDAPGQAVRCATAMVREMRALGIEIRAGLHTSEIEVRGADVAGLGVQIAALVLSEASASEVVVSSVVRDLVAGSGFGFDDRGLHSLKGLPGECRLFHVKGP